jgi:putative ABC transport system substrate-binding protein
LRVAGVVYAEEVGVWPLAAVEPGYRDRRVIALRIGNGPLLQLIVLGAKHHHQPAGPDECLSLLDDDGDVNIIGAYRHHVRVAQEVDPTGQKETQRRLRERIDILGRQLSVAHNQGLPVGYDLNRARRIIFEANAAWLLHIKFALTTPVTAALQLETRTIPIVFTVVADPIGSGFIESLPRPGGNITGVMQYEASVTGKWLAMLKEIAPGLVRAAFVANSKTAISYDFYLRAGEAAAPSLRIESVPILVENVADVERAIESFARVPNGALVLVPDITTAVHRALIITLAARHRLPAVYWDRSFVAAGGLMSYGNDLVDSFRQAAAYVDRILRGDKPAELPVQAATKFETVLNLKTANALGVTVPPGLLVAADEVIE